LCVSCGRHSIKWNKNDAIVIDLQNFRKVTIINEEKEVIIQGGCLNGDVDMVASKINKATVLGSHAGTGVGGLILQGGNGVLARLHGLSIDNLVSIKICTSNGLILDCDINNNSDLFWACRGGYGNFGIVLEFRMVLHDVGDKGICIH